VSRAATNSEPQLIIGRWRTTYLVPADHPDPQSLQHRLDHEFRMRAADASTQALACKLDSTDPSVWRIRRLDLTFAIADNGSEDVFARTGGQQLAAHLAQLISRPESSDSVLHFPNRAAFLAQFVQDLALGRAWGKWYYEEFDSLNALPVNAAIRETLTREPEHAAATVRCLAASQQLDETLAALSDRDVTLIYDACCPAETTSAAVPTAWIERLLTIENEIAAARPASPSPSPRDALRIFARLCDSFSDAETDPRLRTAIDGFLEMRRILSLVQLGSTSDVILGHLAEGNLSSFATVIQQRSLLNPDAGLDFLRRIFAAKTPDAPTSLAGLLAEILQKPSTGRAAFASQFVSPFGGIFMLGPSFLDLDIDSIAATTARNSDEPDQAAALFRHAIAIHCLGRTRAVQTAGDEAVRLFTGFKEAVWADEVAGFDVVEANFESAQLVLAENLVARQRCDGSCLLAETMRHPFSSAELLLIRDIPSNEWLRAVALPENSASIEEIVGNAIRSLASAAGKPDLLLLHGPLIGLHGELKNLAGRVLIADPEQTGWQETLVNHTLVTTDNLSRALASAEPEFASLSLSSAWPEASLPPFLDLTATLVARAVLKHFARRLMGFPSSTPEYLYQNFLSGAAAIRCAPEKIEVQLPQAPLSMILRVSGVSGQSYRLPWLNEKEVCLLSPLD
jgi:hypothetical protein